MVLDVVGVAVPRLAHIRNVLTNISQNMRAALST
jgi:hypothetical protein